ncbi:MAG: hypothetical protein HQM15_10640 [Deltaproteobacteria bacterium]|nr:hypothetical protein [Deltaproteobacteria bacterium]
MQTELMKINANGVLTIPSKFRKLGFDPNQFVNVSLEEDGSLKVAPVEIIPSSQKGFHTKSWKSKEQKASLDLRKKKTKKYASEKDFVEVMRKW